MDTEQLRQTLQRWFAGEQGRRRLWLLTAVAVAVIVVAGIGLQLGEESYAPLFSRLSPEDASAIVARLEEDGVPYRLSQSGATIEVPERDLHRLRLQLAGDGLPSGGVVGLEILDRFQFGSTEFERRMNFLRALQGELTRTIEQIDAVRSARVHIVMPEDSLFVSQRQPATAAVLVELRPGSELRRDQVAAIRHLVAGSVEGLQVDDVTVVDSRGTILSGLAGERDAAPGPVSLENLEIQQRVQQDLQHSVQSLLEQVFGPGNVIARVNADLNFDQTVVEREIFQPADPEGLLRSVQELEEEFEGNAVGQAGFPGTDSNLPLPTAPGTTGEDARYSRNESVRNYELNEIRERIVVAPGTVERLSVSVVVNEELTPEQTEAVRTTVSAALGFDPQRNDTINVIGMPFNTSLQDQLQESMASEQAAEQEAQRRRQVLYAAAAVLLLAALALVLLLMRRSAAQRERQLWLTRRLEQIQQAEQGIADAADQGAPVNERRDEVRLELESIVRQKPDQVAQIVRTWMAEE